MKTMLPARCPAARSQERLKGTGYVLEELAAVGGATDVDP